MIPELLSPAGSSEALRAAVQNGADAVYLGGRLFNARQSASNFSDEELQAATDYSHLRNIKIYLTLNTLIKENEIHTALNFAEKAYSMGVDAVIVQDMGLAGLIRKHIPLLPLHASTQMTVYNSNGVNKLLNMGFERIVLPRELSIQEISEIKKNTSASLEVFIHGALCISYSGQCLLSSAIGAMGERSGNRGACAQPCRLKYKLLSRETDTFKFMDEGHLLSARDINGIEFIKELSDAGIDSFKIEGRMKSPEYVGTITSKYRKALDCAGNIDTGDKEEIMQIFNRGGFSKGYFYGKDPISTVYKGSPKNMGIPLGEVISSNRKNMQIKVKLGNTISRGDGIEILTKETPPPGGIVTGIVSGKNFVSEAYSGQTAELSRIKLNGDINKGTKVIKTSSEMLNRRISETYKENANLKKIPLELKGIFQENSAFYLRVTSNIHNMSFEYISGITPEKAISGGITLERLTEQLSKTDIYPFFLSECSIQHSADLYIPISEINKARKSAFEGLSNKIITSYRKKPHEISLSGIPSVTPPPLKDGAAKNISVMFFKEKNFLELYKNLPSGVNNILLPLEFIKERHHDAFNFLKAGNINITAVFPSILKESDKDIYKNTDDPYIDAFMIGNIGCLDMVKHLNKPVTADMGMNIYNSRSASQFLSMGFEKYTLSCELTYIKDFPDDMKNAELLFYGNIPLMTLEYCPIGGYHKKYPCPGSTKEHFLQGGKDDKYPVLCHNANCRPEIISSKPINLLSAEMAHNLNLPDLIKRGLNNFRINVFNETQQELEDIICSLKKKIKAER